MIKDDKDNELAKQNRDLLIENERLKKLIEKLKKELIERL